MKSKINQIISILFLFAISACQKPIDSEKIKKDVMNADLEFSKLSVEKGANIAFIEYADENVALLRQNNMPIEGKQMLIELLKKRNDSTFTLKWKPIFCSVAQAGDMAYTYGTYEYFIKPSTQDTKPETGTYITIWKKTEDGKWKYVFDGGNEGTKPK